MPFTQVQQLPKQPPTVKIFLTGQLMLKPDEGSNSCEVFVNRSAPNHHLTIEIREKRQGQPDAILMRHHGPLEFRDSDAPIEGLIMRREPAGNVRMYTGAPTQCGEALTTAIDLRSEDFHPANEMAVDLESARPSIVIEDGVFLTAAKTSNKLEIKLKRGEAVVREKMDPFASIIGANVYLGQNEFLHIAWREMGLPKTLSLTQPGDGASYEVYIINDPLFEDPEEAKAHDEFNEYYKVLPTVPTDQRMKLDVKFPETEPADKGSTKTPCMPVIVSGP